MKYQVIKNNKPASFCDFRRKAAAEVFARQVKGEVRESPIR
jgi:hypothetical protein